MKPLRCIAGWTLASACCAVAASEQSLPVQVSIPVRAADRQDDCTPPEYPKAALRDEIQGTVTLAFLIGLDGVVQDSKIRSSGNASLYNTARVALAKCKFKPPVIDGKVTEAWSPVSYVRALQ